MIVVFARSLSAADSKSGRYSMVGDHLSCHCQSGFGIDFIGWNSRSACYPGDEHIGANDIQHLRDGAIRKELLGLCERRVGDLDEIHRFFNKTESGGRSSKTSTV